MAAPHVSGAAAMLLARYSGAVGQPRRIKRILCDTATDLGRERSFQGRGMLDVLRAFNPSRGRSSCGSVWTFCAPAKATA